MVNGTARTLKHASRIRTAVALLLRHEGYGPLIKNPRYATEEMLSRNHFCRSVSQVETQETYQNNLESVDSWISEWFRKFEFSQKYMSAFLSRFESVALKCIYFYVVNIVSIFCSALGGIALFWSLLWFALIHDSPEEHPRISEQEKTYIIESIGIFENKNQTLKVRTPWLSIFTSPPFLSIVLAQYAYVWGLYVLLTMLPTYLSTILKFNLSASGALASLPFIIRGVCMIVGGVVTDLIRKHNVTSTTTIRKFNTAVGLVGQGLCLVLAGYIGCDATAAIAFFTISLAFSALPISGCDTNVLDLAPKYGGIVFSITNTIGSSAGFLAPQIVGLLLIDGNNLGQWQIVFWIAAGLNLLGTIVYLIFAKGEEQEWAKGHITKNKVYADHECKNGFGSLENNSNSIQTAMLQS